MRDYPETRVAAAATLDTDYRHRAARPTHYIGSRYAAARLLLSFAPTQRTGANNTRRLFFFFFLFSRCVCVCLCASSYLSILSGRRSLYCTRETSYTDFFYLYSICLFPKAKKEIDVILFTFSCFDFLYLQGTFFSFLRLLLLTWLLSLRSSQSSSSSAQSFGSYTPLDRTRRQGHVITNRTKWYRSNTIVLDRFLQPICWCVCI